MVNAKDLLAKLLANESINIIRKPAQTASFNLKSRTLTIPLYVDGMNEDVEDLFLFHEIAHALYTPDDALDELSENLHFNIINIVEDNRIERLIKIKYPVCKQIFSAAYKTLWDKKFFGTNKNYNLLDKINIHSKVGMFAIVQFTTSEREIYDRVNKTVTFEDVLEISKELFEDFKAKELAEIEMIPREIKKLLEELVEEQDESNDIVIEEPDATIEDEEDFIEDIDYHKQAEEYDKDKTEEDETALEETVEEQLEETVEEQLEEKLSKQVGRSYLFEKKKSSEFISPDAYEVTNLMEQFPCQSNITFDEILYDYRETKSDVRFENFFKNANMIAQEMNSVFQQKKSASAYRRTQVAATGNIDTKKLHSSAYSDNIFKTITTIKAEKNHGMYFLVDWSGSMKQNMKGTLQQLMYLVMFCRLNRIPHKVHAFSDICYKNTKSIEEHRLKHIELFDHTMTNAQFKLMCNILYRPGYMQHGTYGLNGTPLNSSLLCSAKPIKEFKKKYNIEKMNLIVLTDGCDGSKYSTSGIMLVDPELNYSRKLSDSTSELLKYYKDYQKVNVTYIHVGSPSDMPVGVKIAYPGIVRYSSQEITKVQMEMRQHGYATIENSEVINRGLYVSVNEVSDIAIEGVEDEVELMKNTFIKKMKKMQINRIVCKKFIDNIS